jgi:hypothetical protein
MKIRTITRWCGANYRERLSKYMLGLVRKLRKRGEL